MAGDLSSASVAELRVALRERTTRQASRRPHPATHSPLAVGDEVRRTDGTGQPGLVIKHDPRAIARPWLVCFGFGDSAWVGPLEITRR